jgi:hypothetical protein
MMWLQFLIAGFVFYEAVIISVVRELQKVNPNATVWVIMISKVVKLLLTAGVIFAVSRLTEIPIRTFALTTVGIYVVSLIVESIFFLKKKQNNEQKQ